MDVKQTVQNTMAEFEKDVNTRELTKYDARAWCNKMYNCLVLVVNELEDRV